MTAPSAASPSAPSRPRRLLVGAGALFRAFALALRTPRLWPLLAAPSLTATALLLLLGDRLLRLAVGLAHRAAHGHDTIGHLLVGLFVLVGVLPLLYLAAVVLATVATAPFGGALASHTRRHLTGRAAPAEPLSATLEEAVRSVAHTVGRLALYASLALPLAAVGFFLPPTAPFVAVLQFLVTSVFVAWDFLDYPLSLDHTRFADKWRYLGRHRAESLGLGMMTALLLGVPLANLVVAPLATVAATMLAVEWAGAKSAESPVRRDGAGEVI